MAEQLTEAHIHHQLRPGQLEETIRSIGPEASQLMFEINHDMRNGNSPGEKALMPLLDGWSDRGQ
jgi:hypothetical protein